MNYNNFFFLSAYFWRNFVPMGILACLEKKIPQQTCPPQKIAEDRPTFLSQAQNQKFIWLSEEIYRDEIKAFNNKEEI